MPPVFAAKIAHIARWWHDRPKLTCHLVLQRKLLVWRARGALAKINAPPVFAAKAALVARSRNFSIKNNKNIFLLILSKWVINVPQWQFSLLKQVAR